MEENLVFAEVNKNLPELAGEKRWCNNTVCVTVNDGDNYVTFHELNVRIKIKCHVSRAERSHNNSSQRELRPPVPNIVLRLKQVNFKVQLHDLKTRLVLFYLFCL